MNKVIGPLSYRQEEGSFQKPFSEQTAQLLDSEVRKMVNEAHERTTQLLTEKRDEVEKVAQLLLAKEVLSRFVLSPFFDCEHALTLEMQRRHDRTPWSSAVREGRSLRRSDARLDRKSVV